MRHTRWLLLAGLVLVAVALRAPTQTQTQPRPAPAQRPSALPTRPTTITTATPRLEAVAETRLLMDGLARSNVRGLEKLLKDKELSDEAWTFARGQALLIAEMGNLLLLRPPRNEGQAVWQQRAMDLRSAATNVAHRAAARDHAGTRVALVQLAVVCNRCHQSFRVPTRIEPFAEELRSTRAD
jgi:hypothetical protein